MKKAFLLIVVVVFLVITFLLLPWKGMGQEPIELAQDRVVEIGEQYLDFEITGAEAAARLSDIRVPQAESGEDKERLETGIWLLTRYIEDPEHTYEEIKEQVEYIASLDLSGGIP